MHLTSGESASILLANEENGSLRFEVAIGPKGAEVMDFTLKPGEGIAGWVSQNNRSLIVNDVDDDNRFYANISKQIGYETRSILAVPMRVWNRCIGVIEIINKTDDRHFSEEDRQWLEIFANQAALAIINSQARSQGQNADHGNLKAAAKTGHSVGIEAFDLSIVRAMQQVHRHDRENSRQRRICSHSRGERGWKGTGGGTDS
jgi:GAF domain-containing protein